MDEPWKKAGFASSAMEKDYIRLSESEHPEDQRLRAFLKEARGLVAKNHLSGERLSEEAIPNVYREMFNIENLWKLKGPSNCVIFYALVDDEIKIVDIV